MMMPYTSAPMEQGEINTTLETTKMTIICGSGGEACGVNNLFRARVDQDQRAA